MNTLLIAHLSRIMSQPHTKPHDHQRPAQRHARKKSCQLTHGLQTTCRLPLPQEFAFLNLCVILNCEGSTIDASERMTNHKSQISTHTSETIMSVAAVPQKPSSSLSSSSPDARRASRCVPPDSSHRQHGQFGPTPPDPPIHSAGQSDSETHLSHSRDDAPSLDDAMQQARAHQQIDLAMLRLALRSTLLQDADPTLDDQPASPQIRQLSCSEFNQLVSAVVRLHSGERELFGIGAADNTQDKDNQYDYLERLSTQQLLDLCRQEGIAPPPTCQAHSEKENSHPTSQT